MFGVLQGKGEKMGKVVVGLESGVLRTMDAIDVVDEGISYCSIENSKKR